MVETSKGIKVEVGEYYLIRYQGMRVIAKIVGPPTPNEDGWFPCWLLAPNVPGSTIERDALSQAYFIEKKIPPDEIRKIKEQCGIADKDF